MSALSQVLLIIHVACAALWFGSTMFLPRRLRTLSELDPAARALSLNELAREARIFSSASTLVFVTGLGLAREIGFANLSPRYHVAMTLSLIWVGLDHGVVRRTLALLANNPPTGAVLEAARKRLFATLGVQHLLFTVTLVLMLWRL
jgi:uncharacterized membrane protein